MNRRSLLGFLGGAAAAGPKLAQGLVENAAGQMPAAPFGGFVTAAGLSTDSNWRISRIAKLKDIIAGKSEETKRERMTRRLYEAEAIERYRLDTLRSISATHKYNMLIEGQFERRDRIQRIHAEFELADLLNGSFG